jgi:hypothetical protein
MTSLGLPLMTERDAAEYLGFTPRFMQMRRYKGTGPKFVQISQTAVRYRPEDLDKWVRGLLRESTSDKGSE